MLLAKAALAIAGLSIVGHMLRIVGLFHWLGPDGMAFNTAVGMLFLGFAVLVLANRCSR